MGNGRPIAAMLAALLLVLGLVVGWQRQWPVPVTWPLFGLVAFIVYRRLAMWLERDAAAAPVRPRMAPPASAVSDDLVAISALAEPAMVVSDNWRVISANAGAQAMFGPRLQGHDLRQTVRHPVVVEAVQAAAGGQSPCVREVSTLGQQDGAYRVRAVNLGDRRLLLAFDDITQARLTERMRADFIANASHELRTPLANISGFIETLLGPAAEDAPARRRFLEIMGLEAGRMSRLIDDLLSLSRIELDKYVRPQAALDLGAVLSDVGRVLAMRLEADGREIRIRVVAGLPRVVGDRDQLLQVLHNLVSNALKYGRSGTPILLNAFVEAQPRGDPMLRVQVVDEGDGIAPEHLPRLTERFYRIDAGRSRSMGGTGLGLAIVKHIVERHRGRLEIASRQGAGTVASFLLPIVADDLKAGPVPVPAPVPGVGGGITDAPEAGAGPVPGRARPVAS